MKTIVGIPKVVEIFFHLIVKKIKKIKIQDGE